MRRLSLALVLACVAAAPACVRTRTDPVTGRVDLDVESPTKRGEDWTAKMGGSGSYAAVTGEARAAVLRGESTVSVRLNGMPLGGVHPWAVHEGRCGATGAMFGSAGLYPPMTVNDQGVAEGVARLQTGLDEAKRYHVRVYASPSDMATVAVCGDLSD